MSFAYKNLESQKFLDFQDTDLFGESFSVMREIREQEQLCDVTLKVENQNFPAHRIVLASTIPYFRAMFTNNMIESQKQSITIKEIEPFALKSLINYAYSGQIRIDDENVEALLFATSFMQLYNVQDACTDFLITRFHPNNILGIRNLSYSLGCRRLVSEADKYIHNYFQKVLISEEFLNLEIEELIELIGQYELNGECEEENIFDACLRWIKFKKEKRISFLSKILEHIRLPLLSSDFFMERITKEEEILKSCQLQSSLEKNINSKPESRSSLLTDSEFMVGEIYVLGGETSNNESLNSVEIFNPKTNKWRMGEQMPTIRSFAGIAVLKEKLYVFGGRNGKERFSSIDVFDSKINKWCQRRKMLNERGNPVVAILNNYVYISCGFDGVRFLKAVECYCPIFDTWKTVAPPKERRFSGSIAALNGYIYALGGYDGKTMLDSVERYDPIENNWRKVTAMISKRVRFGVAALDGKLYACGGYDGNSHLRSVEEYDPCADKWRLVAPMNCKRAGTALVVNMNKLWAIGGRDYESVLSSVEVYDPSTDKWSFASPMAVPRYGVGAGVIPY